jgi:fructose/tagatose bisphosphate aldolase
MPVADYATYIRMLDRARTEKFAYPAVNVTSLTTANAVLKGLADSKSDGIIIAGARTTRAACGASPRPGRRPLSHSCRVGRTDQLSLQPYAGLHVPSARG